MQKAAENMNIAKKLEIDSKSKMTLYFQVWVMVVIFNVLLYKLMWCYAINGMLNFKF